MNVVLLALSVKVLSGPILIMDICQQQFENFTWIYVDPIIYDPPQGSRTLSYKSNFGFPVGLKMKSDALSPNASDPFFFQKKTD